MKRFRWYFKGIRIAKSCKENVLHKLRLLDGDGHRPSAKHRCRKTPLVEFQIRAASSYPLRAGLVQRADASTEKNNLHRPRTSVFENVSLAFPGSWKFLLSGVTWLGYLCSRARISRSRAAQLLKNCNPH